MKSLHLILACIMLFGLVSHRPKGSDEDLLNKSFNRYLLEVANDTNVYELPVLQITSSDIYPILDAAIGAAENCKYFDERIRYLHAFQVSARIMRDSLVRYSIYAHKSVEVAIGLFSNRAMGLNRPQEVGVFYYKNYLFSVPISEDLRKESIEYPFYKKTGCAYRVHATSLYNEKTYSSYIDFTIENMMYRITKNSICGEEILIGGDVK